jgi:hypothetical protein
MSWRQLLLRQAVGSYLSACTKMRRVTQALAVLFQLLRLLTDDNTVVIARGNFRQPCIDVYGSVWCARTPVCSVFLLSPLFQEFAGSRP